MDTYEELIEELDLIEDDVDSHNWKVEEILKNAVQKREVGEDYCDMETTAGRAYKLYQALVDAAVDFKCHAESLFTLINALRMENGYEV